MTVWLISSVIEKIYEELFDDPTQINSGWRIIDVIGSSRDDCWISRSNDTIAVAAFFDFGTYPMFLAKETTFSLIVAESRKTSLTAKFELYSLI